MQLGNMTYTDENGNEQTINVNDADKDGSLDQALQYYMKQYDATGDEEMLIKAEAITKLLFTVGGDKGRTTALSRLEKHTFDDTTGVGTRTRSFSDLTTYISRDGKWMADLKNEDAIGFAMVGDGAKGMVTDPVTGNITDSLKTQREYRAQGQTRMRPELISGLSDHVWESIQNEIDRGALNKDSDNYNEKFAKMVRELNDASTATMQDERLSAKVKKETLDNINRTRQAFYNEDMRNWRMANPGKTEADYKAQFGEYRDLERNEQKVLKIPRMPDGFRRATAADRSAHNLGRRVEWVHDDGNGHVRALNAAETQRALDFERLINEAEAQNSARK